MSRIDRRLQQGRSGGSVGTCVVCVEGSRVLRRHPVRDVGRDDPPAGFRNLHPDLRLAAVPEVAEHQDLELDGDDGQGVAEGDHLPPNRPSIGEHGRAVLAELADRLSAVELLGHPEPEGVGRVPEEAGQGLHVVVHQRALIGVRDRFDFGHDDRIIYLHEDIPFMLGFGRSYKG